MRLRSSHLHPPGHPRGFFFRRRRRCLPPRQRDLNGGQPGDQRGGLWRSRRARRSGRRVSGALDGTSGAAADAAAKRRHQRVVGLWTAHGHVADRRVWVY